MRSTAPAAPPRPGRSPGAALAGTVSALWGTESLLVASAASIAFGAAWANGAFSLIGMALVLLPVPLCAAALVAPRRDAPALLWAAATIACALTIGLNWIGWGVALGLAGATTAAVLLAGRRLAWVAVAAAVAMVVLFFVQRFIWGFAGIDVHGFITGAANALIHGDDPYAPTTLAFVPGQPFTPVHLPYGPAVPLLAAPGAAVGDVRVVGMVLMALTVALTGLYAARMRAAQAAAVRVVALFLAMPFVTVVVLYSWVETYTMALFVTWLLLRNRLRPLAVVALALCLLTKPTILAALLPMFVWSPRARREIGWAVGLGLLIALPFLLRTGALNFYDDVIGVHLRIFPTRVDALTLNALFASLQLPFLPWWTGPATVLVVMAGLCTRRPRDAGDLLIAGTLLTVIALLVAKEAFINYWYAAAALALLAVAARGRQLDAEPLRLPRWPLRSEPVPRRRRPRVRRWT